MLLKAPEKATGVLHLLGRAVVRGPWLIVAAWIALVVVLSAVFPALTTVVEDKPLQPLPPAAMIAAEQMAKDFNESDQNILVVALADDKGLSQQDNDAYRTLADTLRADSTDVAVVQDFVSTPQLKQLMVSKDDKAFYLAVGLKAPTGSPQSSQAYQRVTQTAETAVAGTGLTAHVTGQAAIVGDLALVSEHDMHLIEIATAVLVLLILALIYQRTATVALPLITIAVSVVAAQGAVSAFTGVGLGISSLTIVLMTAMIAGAGTDYAVFLISRYHEYLRTGMGSDQAVRQALGSIGTVIGASAATVVVTLMGMIFTKLPAFTSVGPALALSIAVAFLAAITLLPALLVLAGRRGWVAPRSQAAGRFWRRSAVRIVRRPKAHLLASLTVLLTLAGCALTMAPTYNDRMQLPNQAESNLGYSLMAQHFSASTLLPEYIYVHSPNDLRTSRGLADMEQLAQRVSQLPGVATVRGVTRPDGKPIDQAKISVQAGQVGGKLEGASNQIADKSGDLDSLSGGERQLADSLSNARDQIDQAGQSVNATLGQVRQQLAARVQQLTADGSLSPVGAQDLASTVQELDTQLQSGAANAEQKIAGVEQGADQLADGSRKLADAVSTLVDQTKQMGAGMNQAASLLMSINKDATGASQTGMYIPQQVLNSDDFKNASKLFISPDGHSARYVVESKFDPFSTAAMDQVSTILNTARAAQPNTALADATISMVGTTPMYATMRADYRDDLRLIVGMTLAVVFTILVGLLRAVVAPLYLIASVVISYLSALGLGVVVFQFIGHQHLFWDVPATAFIVLVAVGADYNLLLISRIREESSRGIRSGIIRAVSLTGGVITSAGIIFAASMFGLLFGCVSSMVQTGLIIGAGLLIDTFVVRTITVPALAAMVGKANWWPSKPPASAHSAQVGG